MTYGPGERYMDHAGYYRPPEQLPTGRINGVTETEVTMLKVVVHAPLTREKIMGVLTKQPAMHADIATQGDDLVVTFRPQS